MRITLLFRLLEATCQASNPLDTQAGALAFLRFFVIPFNRTRVLRISGASPSAFLLSPLFNNQSPRSAPFPPEGAGRFGRK